MRGQHHRDSRGLQIERTGEASDWQIETAPAVPEAILTLVGAAVVGTVIYGFGAPAPAYPVSPGVALVGGIIVFSLLGLATSAVTKNAEAAQITSLLVMVIAMLGLASIRDILPDKLADAASWTPFAALSDLISLGASGLPAAAAETDAALDFAGVAAISHLVRRLALRIRWFRPGQNSPRRPCSQR